ncbi:hypothetical protein [Radiobacillus sp. PE A8.2]|uniref:hypothetical protein n=1 Tax=Radiobacillus sp. PE A8.2 TaxID=3380349 RepID=UPI0038905E17
MTISELTSTTDYKQAYPLMSELVDHISEQEYLTLLTEMRKEGYRLFGLTYEENMVALAGASIRTDFFNGRHLWVMML